MPFLIKYQSLNIYKDMNSNHPLILLCPYCFNVPLISFSYFLGELKLRLKCKCGYNNRIAIKEYLAMLKKIEGSRKCSFCINIEDNLLFCIDCKEKICVNCKGRHYEIYPEHQIKQSIFFAIFNEANQYFCKKSKIHFSQYEISGHEAHFDWCVKLDNYLTLDMINQKVKKLKIVKNSFENYHKKLINEYNTLFDENDLVILSNCYQSNIRRNEEVYEFLQLMIQNFFACQLNYYVSTNIIRNFKFNYREIEIDSEEENSILINRIKNFYNKYFFVQIDEKNDMNFELYDTINNDRENIMFALEDEMYIEQNFKKNIKCCAILPNGNICYVDEDNWFYIYNIHRKETKKKKLITNRNIIQIVPLTDTTVFFVSELGVIVVNIQGNRYSSQIRLYLNLGYMTRCYRINQNEIVLYNKENYTCIMETTPPYKVTAIIEPFVGKIYVLQQGDAEKLIAIGVYQYALKCCFRIDTQVNKTVQKKIKKLMKIKKEDAIELFNSIMKENPLNLPKEFLLNELYGNENPFYIRTYLPANLENKSLTKCRDIIWNDKHKSIFYCFDKINKFTLFSTNSKNIKEYSYYCINTAIEINEDKIAALRIDYKNNSIITIINMATSQIELEINLGILRNKTPNIKKAYSDFVPKENQSTEIPESKGGRTFTYFESHDVLLEIEQQYIQIYKTRKLN